jgi:hypothetical protein
MAAAVAIEPESPGEVLAAARAERRAADAAEARLLALAVDWAAMRSVDSLDDAAVYAVNSFREAGISIAGDGAPLVAEFAVAEFAAAVRLSTEAGKALIGGALELRHRLPGVWAGVQAGQVPAWRARRVAAATISLSIEAAAYVDRHVCFVAHKVRVAQLDRLVAEAIGRFMPAEAERIAAAAADARHVSFNDQPSFTGTVHVDAELDLADAQDFAVAVAEGAARLAALGSTDTLDGRRATAVGEIARHQLALDLPVTGEDEPGSSTKRPRRRANRVALHVHLSEAALRARGIDDGLQVARIEGAGGRLVLADLVRAWCGRPHTDVVVKPVIDLADHVRVDQYEIPDRIEEPVALRDGGCVFPFCTRPARAVEPGDHAADCDHVVPYARGGPTCPCNLAPLCRHHHRLKTHAAWHYLVLEPGFYLWTSPHGYQFLHDHTGTTDLGRREHPSHGRWPCAPPDR